MTRLLARRKWFARSAGLERQPFFPLLWFFSGNLDKQTAQGNTALHYCSMFDKPECLKLLLRSKPTVDVGEHTRGPQQPWLDLGLPAAL